MPPDDAAVCISHSWAMQGISKLAPRVTGICMPLCRLDHSTKYPSHAYCRSCIGHRCMQSDSCLLHDSRQTTAKAKEKCKLDRKLFFKWAPAPKVRNVNKNTGTNRAKEYNISNAVGYFRSLSLWQEHSRTAASFGTMHNVYLYYKAKRFSKARRFRVSMLCTEASAIYYTPQSGRWWAELHSCTVKSRSTWLYCQALRQAQPQVSKVVAHDVAFSNMKVKTYWVRCKAAIPLYFHTPTLVDNCEKTISKNPTSAID